MKQEGPQLEALTHRLSECPSDFLAEPRSKSQPNGIEVSAVIFDLIRDLGGRTLTKKELAECNISDPKSKEERNVTRLMLIASWLMHDTWFRARGTFGQAAYDLLTRGLKDVAKLVEASQFVSDPDRREELARLCLNGLGLRPAGETEAQAQDRLNTLDSVERARVVKAAREAEERARQIREEMRRKAEEEAAASYGRE